ncbi:hypothetical protein [Methanogenium sp. MK-MG]|uniref:hypothetical protein n=1 Tax=Methanogenium sp. MK-MG TaxID=2599926 RepID=UPI0013EA8EB1|nr:hypothetical protein [Methanogenium sp. MK-MG]KAF1074380.1 hypothetical protein MKMG_01948 [Methanogenium sp. MK-MG]
MFDNHQRIRNTTTVLIIFLFVLTLLFTAGCSDVGHKPLTFKMWLLKIDADGNEQWTTTIDGDPNGRGEGMIQTRDGGYAIAGTGTGPIPRIVTLDADGEAISDMTIGSPPDYGNSLVEAPGGGYAITRRSAGLTRVNESGTVLWSTPLGEESDPLLWEVDKGWRVVRAPDGGYAVAGNNRSVRLDEDGAIVWETTFAPDQSASTIIAVPTGGFVTGGTCDAGVWVTQLNAEGDSVWNRTFSTESPARLYIVRLSPDGTYDLIYETTRQTKRNEPAGKRVTEITEVSLSADGELIGERPVQVTQSIIATDDGGYVYASTSHIVRLDNEGTTMWDASLDIGDDIKVGPIIQTADGGFAISGELLDF